jgi:hypothetical protein
MYVVEKDDKVHPLQSAQVVVQLRKLVNTSGAMLEVDTSVENF